MECMKYIVWWCLFVPFEKWYFMGVNLVSCMNIYLKVLFRCYVRFDKIILVLIRNFPPCCSPFQAIDTHQSREITWDEFVVYFDTEYDLVADGAGANAPEGGSGERGGELQITDDMDNDDGSSSSVIFITDEGGLGVITEEGEEGEEEAGEGEGGGETDPPMRPPPERVSEHAEAPSSNPATESSSNGVGGSRGGAPTRAPTLKDASKQISFASGDEAHYVKDGEVQGRVKVKAKHVDPAGNRSYYTVTMPNGRDRQTTIDRLQGHPGPVSSAPKEPKEVLLTREPGDSWGVTLMNHGLENENGAFVNAVRPDTPAAASPLLLHGARIVRINGLVDGNCTFDKVLDILKDRESTSVTLMILPAKDPHEEEKKIAPTPVAASPSVTEHKRPETNREGAVIADAPVADAVLSAQQPVQRELEQAPATPLAVVPVQPVSEHARPSTNREGAVVVDPPKAQNLNAQQPVQRQLEQAPAAPLAAVPFHPVPEHARPNTNRAGAAVTRAPQSPSLGVQQPVQKQLRIPPVAPPLAPAQLLAEHAPPSGEVNRDGAAGLPDDAAVPHLRVRPRSATLLHPGQRPEGSGHMGGGDINTVHGGVKVVHHSAEELRAADRLRHMASRGSPASPAQEVKQEVTQEGRPAAQQSPLLRGYPVTRATMKVVSDQPTMNPVQNMAGNPDALAGVMGGATLGGSGGAVAPQQAMARQALGAPMGPPREVVMHKLGSVRRIGETLGQLGEQPLMGGGGDQPDNGHSGSVTSLASVDGMGGGKKTRKKQKDWNEELEEKDWNESMQELRGAACDPSATVGDRLSASLRLHEEEVRFTRVAMDVARTILSELHLPDTLKSVCPLSSTVLQVGGGRGEVEKTTVADMENAHFDGSERLLYVKNGLLFRLVTHPFWPADEGRNERELQEQLAAREAAGAGAGEEWQKEGDEERDAGLGLEFAGSPRPSPMTVAQFTAHKAAGNELRAIVALQTAVTRLRRGKGSAAGALNAEVAPWETGDAVGGGGWVWENAKALEAVHSVATPPTCIIDHLGYRIEVVASPPTDPHPRAHTHLYGRPCPGVGRFFGGIAVTTTGGSAAISALSRPSPPVRRSGGDRNGGPQVRRAWRAGTGLDEALDSIGDALALKRHHILEVVSRGPKPRNTKLSLLRIRTSMDTQGRFGSDGRLYLLNLARSFPADNPFQGVWLGRTMPNDPAAEAEAIRVAAEICLFRPELLGACRNYFRERHWALLGHGVERPSTLGTAGLSSDAFRNADGMDAAVADEPPLDDMEALSGSNYQLKVAVPTLTGQLDAMAVDCFDSSTLRDLVHARGINVRNMGHIAATTRLPHVRSMVVTDMIARAAKCLLRRSLRRQHSRYMHARATSGPAYDTRPVGVSRRRGNEVSLLAEMTHESVVDFFNLVLGVSTAAQAFWVDVLVPFTQGKFRYYPAGVEGGPTAPLALLEDVGADGSSESRGGETERSTARGVRRGGRRTSMAFAKFAMGITRRSVHLRQLFHGMVYHTGYALNDTFQLDRIGRESSPVAITDLRPIHSAAKVKVARDGAHASHALAGRAAELAAEGKFSLAAQAYKLRSILLEAPEAIATESGASASPGGDGGEMGTGAEGGVPRPTSSPARTLPALMALVGQAGALVSAGDSEGALAVVELGLRGGKGGVGGAAAPSLYLAKLQALLQLGRRDQAVEALGAGRRAVEDAFGKGSLHPLLSQMSMAMGTHFYRKGALYEASEHMIEAIDLATNALGSAHPSIAQYCTTLGLVRHAEGHWTAAIRNFERALDVHRRALEASYGGSGAGGAQAGGARTRVVELSAARCHFFLAETYSAMATEARRRRHRRSPGGKGGGNSPSSAGSGSGSSAFNPGGTWGDTEVKVGLEGQWNDANVERKTASSGDSHALVPSLAAPTGSEKEIETLLHSAEEAAKAAIRIREAHINRFPTMSPWGGRSGDDDSSGGGFGGDFSAPWGAGGVRGGGGEGDDGVHVPVNQEELDDLFNSYHQLGVIYERRVQHRQAVDQFRTLLGSINAAFFNPRALRVAQQADAAADDADASAGGGEAGKEKGNEASSSLSEAEKYSEATACRLVDLRLKSIDPYMQDIMRSALLAHAASTLMGMGGDKAARGAVLGGGGGADKNNRVGTDLGELASSVDPEALQNVNRTDFEWAAKNNVFEVSLEQVEGRVLRRPEWDNGGGGEGIDGSGSPMKAALFANALREVSGARGGVSAANPSSSASIKGGGGGRGVRFDRGYSPQDSAQENVLMQVAAVR